MDWFIAYSRTVTRCLFALALVAAIYWFAGWPDADPVAAAPQVAEAVVPPTPAIRAAPAAVKPAPVAATASVAEPDLVVRRVLDTGGPIHYGDWFWDESGAPDGPVIITVDLAASTISAFRGGYEIGTTAIVYGMGPHPTPLGTFPILAKFADHVSRKYGNAPMPFTQRLTGDGVSIHGSEVAWGYVSHGCIGVPVAFAKKLFGVTKLGDRVIITDGKALSQGQPVVS